MEDRGLKAPRFLSKPPISLAQALVLIVYWARCKQRAVLIKRVLSLDFLSLTRASFMATPQEELHRQNAKRAAKADGIGLGAVIRQRYQVIAYLSEAA